MQLGRVIGTIVATVKDPSLHGIRLLLVEPLDNKEKPTGPPIVAIDVVSAGRGEKVFLVTAREAAHALPSGYCPVDAAIVGIVDRIDSGDFKPTGRKK